MLTPDRTPFHIPTERGKVGRYCILPGAPERVEQIAALLEEPVFVGRNREFTVWNGKLAGETVTVCSTGIRVSELRYITVSAVKSGRADIRLKGKMRTILLPDELCRMLRRYAAERNITEGSIFVSRKGTPVNRSTVGRMFKKLCGEAGVERQKVFPHNLRHLFARTFYAAQKDIVRLADILGHSNINTTRIYTMESGEIFRSTLTNLGLLRC